MNHKELVMAECEIAASKYKTPEKIVEVACTLFIERIGGWSFKINQPGSISRNIKGISDRIALFKDKVVFVECKAGSPQSYHQKKFEDKVKLYNGFYCLVHSVKELADYLESIGIIIDF